jgi:MoaA/NifB/PqqE/SkfB family radical SAM enzyme
MKIRSANVEVTTICNAKCPLCARQTLLDANFKIPVKHLDLKAFKELDWHNVPDFEYFVLCGGFGDPVLHPQFDDLLQIIRALNKRVIIHTNGDVFNEKWWARLGKSLDEQDNVTFGLDGLTMETHIKYRGTSFDRLTRNIKAYTDAGGQGGINYIVFKHNEHEISNVSKFTENLGLNYAQLRRSRKYNDQLQVPDIRPTKDWEKPCFAEIGEVSIDIDSMIHLCCQSYVRHFIKEIIGDKTPEWVKPLKRYKTFQKLQESVYINYIKQMELCHPCGQLRDI